MGGRASDSPEGAAYGLAHALSGKQLVECCLGWLLEYFRVLPPHPPHPTQARSIEESFVGRWQRAGVQPPPHPLVPDAAAAAAFLRHPDEWQG